jgi:hypothetical protein
MRKLHLVVGLAGVVTFLATGIFMRAHFPDLYSANEALRYIYRANHVYILLASLANLALGVHLAGGRTGWRAKLSTVGSILALASPVVLCFAFVFEASKASPDRIVTLLGVFALAFGIAAQALSGPAQR